VRIPRLHAGTADTFYLYHSPEELPDASDPASVWDSNYLFVHHMAATGGATRVYDSTANAMTGTAANVTLGVEGFISGGVLTDGIAGHWISLANAFSRPTSDTFEVMFKNNSPDTLQRMIFIYGNNNAYWFGINATNQLESYVHQGNSIYRYAGASLISTGQLYYAADVYSSWAGRSIYANGELDAAWNNMHYPHEPWWVNKIIGYGFNGELDEVRFSKSVRSASWIHAQHVSMHDRLLEVGTLEFTAQGSVLMVR
jgi:hypothetical protein